jgi:hypothetical protein
VAVTADVTGLLQAWSGGDAAALDQLAPLVHRELREMARRLLVGERLAVGWQPTDLLQESYVRLLDWRAVHWQSRAHFFATTARMMRRVLVDAARARQAAKRGHGVEGVSLEAPDGTGGAWSPTGTIVFGPDMIFEGLSRVSADGGPVQPATQVDFDRGENSHRWPVFLPDGIHFLFFVRASIDERRGVYVARLDRPASTPGSPLFRSESEAVFIPTSGRNRGVLLSTADGQLQARPFDAAALTLVGDPRTLPVAAGANTPYHPAMLSASADLLATVAMRMPYGVRLGTVARDGTAVRLSERQPQNWPRLSPDGRR